MSHLPLQIQSSALDGFEDLVSELGGDAAYLTRQVGLSLVDIKRRGARLPIEKYIKLIEKASIETNYSAFGMVLGSRQAFYAIGHLGVLIQSCASVRQAIEVGISFSTYHNQGEIWQLETHDHISILRRVDLYHELADTRQYKEMAMAVCIKLFQVLLGNKLDGVTIDLPHQQHSNLSDYLANYCVPVNFNSEQEAIVFPSSYLNVQIESSNTALKHSLEQEIKKEQQRQSISYTARAQQVIEQTLGWQESNIEVVANSLNIHARTLQRRLAEEGITFKRLLTDIRMKTACSYLACSQVDITLLAARLGYREVSNFSRVFKAELGLSPREWRRLFRAH